MKKIIVSSCKTCSKSIEAFKIRQYCSRSCQTIGSNRARPKIHHFYEKACELCGEIYTAYSGNASKFCSKTCQSENKKIVYKGRKLTPEWLQNQNESKTREKIVKYGEFVCQKCFKVFKTNLSLRSHSSYCHSTDEPRDVKCSLCDKTFVRQRSLTVHVKLKHDAIRNAEHKAKVSLACLGRVTQSTSNAETIFLQSLKEIYPDVIHKFKIEDSSHEFDYYVPSKNLIVEYDGDYWHGNPANHTLTHAMKKQYYVDIANTKFAMKKGFTVYRIWASESDQYPNKMRKLPCQI